MQTTRVRGRGFSLIELLIVMVIIAILVLIAIPAISQYRSNARIAAVQSDLRNAATAVESSFLTKGAYPAVGDAASTYARVSTGVTLAVVVSDGDRVCINGQHDSVAAGDNFYYASYDGAGSVSGVAVERGVHSGSCAVGTTSGGTLTAGSGGEVVTPPVTPPAATGVTISFETGEAAAYQLVAAQEAGDAERSSTYASVGTYSYRVGCNNSCGYNQRVLTFVPTTAATQFCYRTNDGIGVGTRTHTIRFSKTGDTPIYSATRSAGALSVLAGSTLPTTTVNGFTCVTAPTTAGADYSLFAYSEIRSNSSATVGIYIDGIGPVKAP